MEVCQEYQNLLSQIQALILLKNVLKPGGGGGNGYWMHGFLVIDISRSFDVLHSLSHFIYAVTHFIHTKC